MNAESGHREVLDRLIPIKAAALELGCGLRTLERQVAAGKFPNWIKNGNKRVYPFSVIAAQIERMKRGESWQG